MKTLTSLLFLLVFHFSVSAQKLTYEAFFKDKNVGQIEVQREVSDNKTSISSITNLEVKLLVRFKLQVEVNSIYQNGILIETDAKTIQNGKLKKSVQITKLADSYKIDINGKTSELDEQKLIGADMFYFEEPEEIDRVLALASGDYFVIRKTASSIYEFEKDGDTESHIYKDGVLTTIKMKKGPEEIEFRLKK